LTYFQNPNQQKTANRTEIEMNYPGGELLQWSVAKEMSTERRNHALQF